MGRVAGEIWGFAGWFGGKKSAFLQILRNQRNQRNRRLGDSAKKEIMAAMSKNDIATKVELRPGLKTTEAMRCSVAFSDRLKAESAFASEAMADGLRTRTFPLAGRDTKRKNKAQLYDEQNQVGFGLGQAAHGTARATGRVVF